MDYLLKTHATICKQQGKPDAMRKHNAFVLRYVAGASVKEGRYTPMFQNPRFSQTFCVCLIT